MIYEPNTHHWQPGDLVIHDADAKIPEMLMAVLGYNRKTGLCRTRYVQPDFLDGMGKVMWNELKFLHDPAKFGLQIQKSEEPV